MPQWRYGSEEINSHENTVIVVTCNENVAKRMNNTIKPCDEKKLKNPTISVHFPARNVLTPYTIWNTQI